MTDKVFIDSNLWVYLYDKKEGEKQNAIKTLISDNFNFTACISISASCFCLI